jgi:hypothetical protein
MQGTAVAVRGDGSMEVSSMLDVRRRMSLITVGATLGIGALAAPAVASYCEEPPPPPPTDGKAKCNSGNGNGSDAITFVVGEHCYGGDPGKSYDAGNRGGDEIPTSGGVENPGGNNVD